MDTPSATAAITRLLSCIGGLSTLRPDGSTSLGNTAPWDGAIGGKFTAVWGVKGA